MSYELRKSLGHGIWDDQPDTFLPETIITMAFKVIPHLTADISKSLALLSWLTTTEVENYFQHLAKHMEQDLINEIERNRWQDHDLFKTTKENLEKMCKENELIPTGTKLQLIQKLADKLWIEKPDRTAFDGDLTALPDNIQGIHRLSIAKIKEVLNYFQIPTIGTKDELALRLLALRLGSKHLIFQKEASGILDLIKISKQLIFAQKSLYICQEDFIHRVRTFGNAGRPTLSEERPRSNAGASGEKRKVSEVQLPFGISEENLHEVFDTLIILIERINSLDIDVPISAERSLICQAGNRIIVYWGCDDLLGTEWKEGWFPAKVLRYDKEKDEITMEYVSEEGKSYHMNVADAIEKKLVKSARTTMTENTLYDQIIEVGTRILIKWTKAEAEVKKMNSGRWYAAEVQDYSAEDDTITIIFRKDSSVHTIDVTAKIIRGEVKMSKAVI